MGTISWAAPSPDGFPAAAHLADRPKPAGQGKLSFQGVNSKVVFSDWVFKKNTQKKPQKTKTPLHIHQLHLT